MGSKLIAQALFPEVCISSAGLGPYALGPNDCSKMICDAVKVLSGGRTNQRINAQTILEKWTCNPEDESLSSGIILYFLKSKGKVTHVGARIPGTQLFIHVTAEPLHRYKELKNPPGLQIIPLASFVDEYTKRPGIEVVKKALLASVLNVL